MSIRKAIPLSTQTTSSTMGRKKSIRLICHKEKHLGSFKRTTFAGKDETTSANIGPRDLTNDIHVLFDKDHLKTCFDDYAVVEQSARLASHLLMSQQVQHLFHALITGHGNFNKRKRETGREDKWYVYREADLKTDKPLTQEEQGHITARFEYLARYLTYQIDERENDFLTAQQTEPIPAFPLGYQSIIRIPQGMITGLEEAHNGTDVPRLLVLRFEVAVALIHEVTHALRNLCSGKLDCEPFVGETSPLAELGFEIEKRMFGGIITRLFTAKSMLEFDNYYTMYHDGKRSECRGILVLLRYPSRLLRELYRGQQCMGIRNEKVWLKKYDVAWRVPLEFVAKLFTAKFWTKTPEEIVDGLLPEWGVGYSFHWDSKQENFTPVEYTDKEENYVPQNYQRNKDCEIVPVPRATDLNSTAAQPDIDDADAGVQRVDGGFSKNIWSDESTPDAAHAEDESTETRSHRENAAEDVVMADAHKDDIDSPLKRRRDSDDDGATGSQVPPKKHPKLTLHSPGDARPLTPEASP